MKADNKILIKQIYIDGKRIKKNIRTKGSMLNTMREVLKDNYNANNIHFTYINLN